MAETHSEGKSSRWSLQNATAFVTGGTLNNSNYNSSGIGYAIVEELAALGAIIHTCSPNESQLNDCLREWKEKGIRVTGSVCDVTSSTEREKLIETTSSIFNGKLDILINNVATNFWKPTVEFTSEDYSLHMTTNVESAYHLSQLSYSLLKASGAGGRLIFLSFIAVAAALIQLTKNLACEWAKDGIRVNSVAPGLTRTPLVQIYLEDEKLMKRINSQIPLGRIAEPDEVSSTGQTIVVDGGATVNGFSFLRDSR